MYRLIWCMFSIAIITSTAGESEDEIWKSEKKVNRHKLVQVVSELSSEFQMLRQDMQALREEVQNQRNAIVENQEHLILRLQETIADNREGQDSDKHGSSAVSGFSFEVLRTEHDTMLHEIQTMREEVRESNVENQEQFKQILELLSNPEMQQWGTESQEENANSQIKLSNDVLQNLSALERGMKQIQSQFSNVQPVYQSCKDVPKEVSGKYKIRVNEYDDPYEVYCEQKQVGGGWMVIQYRFDGSQNFNRNWTDYRNGFGDVDGEHWLGLEKIYQFTMEHDCELLVEMKSFDGVYKYAWYNSFAIGSEFENYKLETLGKLKGSADNALEHQKGYEFSTPDRDNDNAKFNCAKSYSGGWWFNACYKAFLNGPYRNVDGRDDGKITWQSKFDNWPALSYSRMMIRPLN